MICGDVLDKPSIASLMNGETTTMIFTDPPYNVPIDGHTFYRYRHKLIFAFNKVDAPHINTFELGQHGRYRTNVCEYRSVNTMPPKDTRFKPGQAGNPKGRLRGSRYRRPGMHEEPIRELILNEAVRHQMKWSD